MGLPAVRQEPPARAPRPELTLVKRSGTQSSRRANRPASSAACHSARCREAFTTFVLVLALFAALGVARVAVASQAAASSIESGELRKQIKRARFEGDMLEIKQSALANPSRVRWYVQKNMRMAEARKYTYLTIEGAKKKSASSIATVASVPAKVSAGSREGSPSVSGLLASIMHTAAGEAQVLLLGDVGLSASR